jgi:hypothetical protein
VLLPAPEYPITPKISPSSIDKLTPSIAVTTCWFVVKTFDTLSNCTIVDTMFLSPLFVTMRCRAREPGSASHWGN